MKQILEMAPVILERLAGTTAEIPRDLISWLLQTKTICVAAAAYAVFKVVHALYISPLRNVPGSFWARLSIFPTLISDIKGDEQEYVIGNYKKYGNVFILEPEKVGICDPADCRLILSTHAFRKEPRYERPDFLEPNTFLTCDPELNKQRRRQIGPAFNITKLRQMEPTILSAGAQSLVEKWERVIDDSEDASASICYYYDFNLMAFDVITRLGFGRDFRALHSNDRTIVKSLSQVLKLMILQIILPEIKSFPLNVFTKGMRKDIRELFSIGDDAISKRRKDIAEGKEPNDILQSFIDAEDPESRIKMTPGQVTSENIIMLIGGTDTTGNTLSWTINLLLLHPRHYRRAVYEVRNAFTRDHVITYDEVREKLPYTEACIYESLRIRPVSGNLPRVVPRGGVVFQGNFIPEGYALSVCISAANMNESSWKKPYMFYPKRFINNEHNKQKVLTFSSGVRICPGRNLAWMEMLTTLANLLNKFDFTLPEDSLFTPNNLDDQGQPIIMPRSSSVTCGPRYPDRDCKVIIKRRE